MADLKLKLKKLTSGFKMHWDGSLRFVLSVGLILQSMAPFQAQAQSQDELYGSYGKATVETAFLKDLYARVELYLGFNYGHIHSLYECDKKTPGLDLKKCNESLNRVLSEIELNHPRIRRHQLIHHLSSPANNAKIFSLLMGTLKQPVEARHNRISVRLADLEWIHPMASPLLRSYLPPANQWSSIEIQTGLEGLKTKTGELALIGYQSLWKKICLASTDQDVEFKNKAELICNGTKLKFETSTQSLYFELNPGLTPQNRPLFLRLRNQMAPGLDRLHRETKDLFLSMVQILPYAGLVSSPQPTTEDFSRALQIMDEASFEALENIRNQRAMFYNQTPPQSRTSLDRYRWIKLLGYKPIVKDVVRERGDLTTPLYEIDLQNVSSELESEFMANEFGKVGLLIGANVLFCAAGGRLLGVFKVLRSSAPGFKELCMPMTSIPINLGFLVASVGDYGKIYR